MGQGDMRKLCTFMHQLVFYQFCQNSLYCPGKTLVSQHSFRSTITISKLTLTFIRQNSFYRPKGLSELIEQDKIMTRLVMDRRIVGL